MQLLATLLALIGLHAVFVSAEYAFVKMAYSEKQPIRCTFRSSMSAAICRQLEDYLTVCALAKTIILMSIGILLGLFFKNLGSTDLDALAVVSWPKWVPVWAGR